MAAHEISAHRLLQTRVNAGQHHRLVVAGGRQREARRTGQRGACRGRGLDEPPAIQRVAQEIAATWAGRCMDIRPKHGKPPLIIDVGRTAPNGLTFKYHSRHYSTVNLSSRLLGYARIKGAATPRAQRP